MSEWKKGAPPKDGAWYLITTMVDLPGLGYGERFIPIRFESEGPIIGWQDWPRGSVDGLKIDREGRWQHMKIPTPMPPISNAQQEPK